MRRNKKRKIRKTIIFVTALLFILFGAFLIIDKFNKDEPPLSETHEEEPANNNNEQEEETSVEPEKEPEEEPEEPVQPEEPGQEQPAEETDYSIIIENPEKIDVLVNKTRALPENYVPEDLVTLSEVPTVLSNPEVNQLRNDACEALTEMFNAAKDEGYELHARSGYRSYYTQAALYSSYVESYGKQAADKYSAKPGQSEHQTGLSMDITCEALNYKLDTTFDQTEEGKWVLENAHHFGFIIRYPKGKEEITGYSYEPWHIRYLGIELAEEVYDSGLTLDEYFQ